MDNMIINKTDVVFDYAVRFLTGNFPYSGEMQAFWIAVQGSMAVRQGPNADGKLTYWHAFVLSMIMGFGGGWMGFVLLGKPSAMIANDINAASAILAFILVNYTPFDIGFMLLNTTPFRMVTVAFAQLFRSLGIAKFVMACFENFKDNPSPYYNIPMFGPIFYGALLGNWGGMLLKGFEGYNKDGMPWGFQNGIFCASFFHFYANDQMGPVGAALRKAFPVAGYLELDDRTFATCFISLFMQIFNPQYNPVYANILFKPKKAVIPNAAPVEPTTTKTRSTPSAPENGTKFAESDENDESEPKSYNLKRKKKKKKAKQS